MKSAPTLRYTEGALFQAEQHSYHTSGSLRLVEDGGSTGLAALSVEGMAACHTGSLGVTYHDGDEVRKMRIEMVMRERVDLIQDNAY